MTMSAESRSKIEVTAAVAKGVRALAPKADGWVFESQPGQPSTALSRKNR